MFLVELHVRLEADLCLLGNLFFLGTYEWVSMNFVLVISFGVRG